MTKYLNCLKAVALAFVFGLLAACAHPDSVNLGTSYDSVMDKLGAPDSRTVLPDGTLRLVLLSAANGSAVLRHDF